MPGDKLPLIGGYQQHSVLTLGSKAVFRPEPIRFRGVVEPLRAEAELIDYLSDGRRKLPEDLVEGGRMTSASRTTKTRA